MKRASLLVDPGSVVRVVGYEPDPGVLDEDFIRAFRVAAELDPRPSGLVHRELCLQVPAWNEKITFEIQHANPFTFIDYAILRPDQDPAELSPLPADLAAKYQRTEATYAVTNRFRRADAQGEPGVVPFNMFEVNGPPAVAEAFARNWAQRAEYQSHKEGFFSVMLHQQIKPGGRFAVINRMEWQSADHYAATLVEYDLAYPRVERGRGPGAKVGDGPQPVQSFLGLFCVVAAVSSGGS